ncbi:hypothetical protein LCGC14_0485100 [marine sediment metagenome]|uniref:Uncharacterized protein n=1 Tax=marine sediment metagenome TaxID=412755 RepID=A0A0F9SRI4_9ZZZZ
MTLDDVPKTPFCHKKHMELKAVNRKDNYLGDIFDFYYQCKTCGKVKRK